MSGPAQSALVGAVRAYRYFLSPWLGSACRFEPTCSAYALDALGRHGAARGLALTLGRLGRCHPWCAGGFDPVPAEAPPFFTALLGQARRAPAAHRAPSEPTT
jgi:putative membrane protein insertion efficiency factor